MNDLLRKSALELADMLAAGRITSVELTTACLDRIEAVDPPAGHPRSAEPAERARRITDS